MVLSFGTFARHPELREEPAMLSDAHYLSKACLAWCQRQCDKFISILKGLSRFCYAKGYSLLMPIVTAGRASSLNTLSADDADFKNNNQGTGEIRLFSLQLHVPKV